MPLLNLVKTHLPTYRIVELKPDNLKSFISLIEAHQTASQKNVVLLLNTNTNRNTLNVVRLYMNFQLNELPHLRSKWSLDKLPRSIVFHGHPQRVYFCDKGISDEALARQISRTVINENMTECSICCGSLVNNLGVSCSECSFTPCHNCSRSMVANGDISCAICRSNINLAPELISNINLLKSEGLELLIWPTVLEYSSKRKVST